MNRKSTLLLALVLLPAAAARADSGDELTALIEANRYPLALSQDGLSGPGAAWLLERAADAQYVMLGEQHGTADIAELSTALYRELRGLGFSHAAVEIGPWSTRIAESWLRDGDTFEQYVTSGDRILTFPFLFFTEEVEFARTVIGLSGDDADALWGLDQEFVAAAGPLLDLLESMAQTPAQRAAIADTRDRAAANPMLLGSGADEDWQGLVDAYADTTSVEARRLVDDVVLSRRIYAPFTGRGGSVYAANDEREHYMKTLFREHLERTRARSGTAPKVFLKFGANHVAYGHSPTHVLTLGTFVHELAWSEGQRAFNVHVDCRGGLSRDPRDGSTPPCESYFLGPDSSLGAFLEGDAPMLLDLTALRTRSSLWKDFDEKSRDLVWAYDAIVVIPDTRAATLLGP